jgi:RNA polymerase sigma-70 factor, ECF subfamily
LKESKVLVDEAQYDRTRPEELRETLDRIYRAESGRILATLIRLLGDFDLAEDALQEAFAAAARQWPRDGVPANPRAWLVSAGRFKAIDALRRKSRTDAPLDELEERLDVGTEGGAIRYGAPATGTNGAAPWEDEDVEDDQLRLIFTCCHPALPSDARVALTLREVCGLTTEEIARAFLTGAPTVAQRIVRAKAKIRDAGIPFEVPASEELAERLDTVLQVIYLAFNEGYLASTGASLTRADLSGEAIRLGRLLLDLLPEPEVAGLLALMLLQDSRRAARTSPEGDLVTLEEQDRTLWNRKQIAQGAALVRQALGSERYGHYTLQAAIAAVHGRAASAAETDWGEIVRLYDALAEMAPSPVVELNRAVAVAMAYGPEAGLSLVDGLLRDGELSRYHLAHATRADLCRRLGRTAEAHAAYEQALALTQQESEKRYLERRLAELAR